MASKSVFVVGGLCRCLIKRNFAASSVLGRLKSEWRVDRRPANTKLASEDVIEQRKAFGGRKKWKAISLSKGNYSLESAGIEKCLPILDVVHSDAGRKYGDEKILIKSAYILVDAESMKNELTVDTLLFSSKQLEAHTIEDEMKENVRSLLESGKLYAKITSRPGQVGNCDGVIVEGKELLELLMKLNMECTE